METEGWEWKVVAYAALDEGSEVVLGSNTGRRYSFRIMDDGETFERKNLDTGSTEPVKIDVFASHLEYAVSIDIRDES